MRCPPLRSCASRDLASRRCAPRGFAALAALALFGASAGAAGAQDTPLAFTGAHLVPVSGPEIERGTLVVHRGVIVAAGPSDQVTVPADARSSMPRAR
jgi:hypothetical protein